jgi:Fe-S cluster assembly protein SufD
LWRYSDPALYFPKGPLPQAGSSPSIVSRASPGEAENRIVLFSDRPPEIHLDPASAAAGLEVTPLASSKAGIALIGKAVALDHGVFESLNGAIWSQGIFVRVSKGVALERPITLLRTASSGTAVTRVVVAVEPGASLTLVEKHVGGSPGATVIAASELFVKPDAQLSHVLLQTWEESTVGNVTSRAKLERDALFTSAAIALGGRRYKADVGAVLKGVGAESRLVGVALTDGRRLVDLHTVHDHQGPRTRSRIACKAALFDKSTSAYTGLIRVAENAELSEAFQENRNLLLSDKCRADSIPELEIETNEVQCTHAATAAPIDEDQLFYLKSRGIKEADAVGILVNGFFEDALAPVPGAVRSDIMRAVSDRLSARYQGGHP